MNESVGSVWVIMMILIFITVMSGYMAFNVNYTKAFRVKNKVVDSINKYGDDCLNTWGSCYKNEIAAYAKSLGYESPNNLNCPKSDKPDEPYASVGNTFCYIRHNVPKSNEGISEGSSHYFTITTRIDINIPMINNLLGVKVLTITGDTKSIED